MIELVKIQQSGFFEEIHLQKGEILFHEGDTDENMYIVYDGELSVEKLTPGEKKETKILATLGVGNILGEGALNGNYKKEVSIRAYRDTIIGKIHAKEGFHTLLQNDNLLGINILKSIIHISNIRLLRSNSQLAAIHEIHAAINNLKELNTPSILGLIDVFSKIMNCESFIYIEKHPYVDNYLEYKYDSRHPGKLQEGIIESDNGEISMKILEKQSQILQLQKYIHWEVLSIGDIKYGYLVISRNSRPFEEHEKKMLGGISSTFVGVIRQKKILEDEKNKKYMKNI